MSVNPKVDKPGYLLEVPGLNNSSQTAWKIRLLNINDHCPALVAISCWSRTSKSAFEEIMRVMRLVGTSRKPPSVPFVSQGDISGIYEMCGPGSERLMFFYDQPLTVAVCTHDYEAHSRRDRERAFGLAERIRQHYFSCLKSPDSHEHKEETP